MPESGFTEEELQKLLSDEEDNSKEGIEISQDDNPDNMSIIEPVDQTSDVVSKGDESAQKTDPESQSYNETRFLKVVEEDSGESKDIDSVEKTDITLDSQPEEKVSDTNVGKSEDLDHAFSTSYKGTSSARIVGSSHTQDDSEENLSEARDSGGGLESMDGSDMTIHLGEDARIGSKNDKDDEELKSNEDIEVDVRRTRQNENEAIMDTEKSSIVSALAKNPTASDDPREKLKEERSDLAGDEDDLLPTFPGTIIEKEETLDQPELMLIHDSKDYTISDSSVKENSNSDVKEHEVGDEIASKDTLQAANEAVEENSVLLKENDEVLLEEKKEKNVNDENADEIQDEEDKAKRNVDDFEGETLREELSAGEDHSDETESQDKPGDGQDSLKSVKNIISGEVIAESQDSLQTKVDQVDAEGIFASIRKFLPGGGSPKKNANSEEETATSKKDTAKSNEEKSNQFLEVSRFKVPVDIDEVSPDDSGKENVKNVSSEKKADVEIFEKVNDYLAGVGSEKVIKSSTLRLDTVEERSAEELGDNEASDHQRVVDLLSEVLEEESSETVDAAVLSATSDKKNKASETISMESSLASFLNNTESSLPAEKTLDKGFETGDDTSEELGKMESKVAEAGIAETKSQFEETETEIKETKIVKQTNVVSTKTFSSSISDTTTVGHRPFQKKLPNIASKWIKNKLMKEKRTAAAEKTEIVNESVPSGKVDKSTYSRNVDESLNPITPAPGDSYSNTCAKDGTCHETNSFSSSLHVHRSILGSDDSDEVAESNSSDEQPEGKSVKVKFLENVAVAVRMFREYHNLAAEHGLKMLKPVKNIVKSLGEQIGLEEVSVILTAAVQVRRRFRWLSAGG